MPEIISTKYCDKKLLQFKSKHPELRENISKLSKFLESNPSHPSLRLHKFKGNLSGRHSVSLNMKYGIRLDFIIKDDQVILIDIENHGMN